MSSQSPVVSSAATPPGQDDAPGVDRRRFIGYVVKGSTLAVALSYGADTLTSGDSATGAAPSGRAAQLLGIPELADVVDLTDLLLLSGDPFYYDFLIRITPENRIRFELPRMEVGQGIETASVMIVAEELDVAIDQIDVSLSPAEIRRATGQITGGSHSVSSLWDPLRKVTAALRTLIVHGAAAQLGVAPNQITTANGIASAPDGRSVRYADVSDGVEGRNDLARTAVPKDPSHYRVIGSPTNRIDARDIVTGRVQYAMDLDVVPDALPTVVARPPTLGGTVRSYDASAALAMPGVVAACEVPTDVEGASSGVAVVARSFGEAFKARDALQIEWNGGTADHLSDDDIIEQLRAINLPTLPAIPILTKSVSGEFIFPYVAHAPLETMTAIADVSGGRARVWTGAKTPIAAQAKIARDLGLLPTNVEVNVVKSGGSFGRRLFFDAAVESARISSIVGRPIKLMFTRQEDTKFGRARPLSIHKVQATYRRGGLLGGPGKVLTFDHRAATSALDARHGFGEGITAFAGELGAFGFSQTLWHTTQLVQYDFGLTSLLLNEKEFPVATSSWRGIYSGTAVVANEVIVDELARELGEDEYAFRMRTLDDDRSKAVLQAVAEAGGWGRSMPRRTAQGLGLHNEYKSRAAVLAEIKTSPSAQQDARVTKMVVAVDVNRVVNPKGLEAQVIGAATDAITTILRTGLHLDNGAIRESSYGDFEIAQMKHTPPEIEVIFMPTNGDRPGGAGELVVPAAAAAIANAFARATGIKPRRFPLRDFYEEA
ncbi:isoquinoline 1-oxidoreductase beta subunit [Ilumatobacter fluminis]|uniref:Isoquinoline 1-oxidoreductase beta subunit n=1 Tax=Ilumatobacter fluminis TaxID=467091 RepID=A0A4R7HUZ9_9ACTN|nr:molybdopterin cofactor-binding domain-containing protein [Ilumatobacter fluminis]TDT14752.1 isoquinoline 1-oxidoreductase beta subunit [Ilumatobacter fluminis]